MVRFLKKAFLPFVDASLIISILFFITHYWKTLKDITFDQSILNIALPSYTLIWMTSIYFSGGYDKPFKSKSSLYGTLVGTIIILTLYALLPKSFQFSRLFILLGAFIVMLYYVVSRQLLSRFIGGAFSTSENKQKNFAIVGSKLEIERVEQLLKQNNPGNQTNYSISANDVKLENQLGTISQLDQIVHLHPIDEVIFCAKDISSNAIINWMVALNKYPIDFKIAHPDSLYLIGSNSTNTNGELYTIDLYNINTPSNKRNKRTFDFFVSLICILVLPITFWLYSNKTQFITNLVNCLIGKKTWVGFSFHSTSLSINLPKISDGIFNPTSNSQTIEPIIVDKLNMIYARDYSVKKDWDIFKKNLRYLDRKS